MSRIFKVSAITAVAVVVGCGSALASVTPVTGGTTQIAVSSPVMSLLGANHLSLAPLIPATASGSTFSFPISRGHLNAKKQGKVHHTGGLVISNGTRRVRMRGLTLVSGRGGVSLFAVVRARPRTLCLPARLRRLKPHCVFAAHAVRAKIARITAISLSNGQATGTVRLSEFSAAVVDSLAGKVIARGGSPIGTITIAPQLG